MFIQSIALALPIGQAIDTVATRLDNEQIKDGISAGIWPEEASFTGSIAAGMVSAYKVTCDSAYKSSAELGGSYIVWAAGGNFYGDEAFCLTRLSDIANDPCNNPWRTAVSDFYYNVKHKIGTEAYISQFVGTGPSTAVFYLANHVVAAYHVNAEDKQIWRQGLIDWLAHVDNSSDFPVMAMGVATWALAQTGPLDETLIDPCGTGAPYWNSKKLADLPILLLSHQVPSQLYAGSFYWRFDHSDGGLAQADSGYTEDTIFGTLGLIAAADANPDLDMDAAILAARQALLDGVYGGGIVYNHLWLKGTIYYTYAGEMLQVIRELIALGDLNLDGTVNFIDFAIFANQWRSTGCTACDWCNGADIDHSGEVNFADLKILTENWLKGASE
jgi:hypothetical protein